METQDGRDKKSSVNSDVVFVPDNVVAERIPQTQEELETNIALLPKINIGALFATPVWGPAHGHWITVLLYPLWVFVDDTILAAVKNGGVAIVLAAIVTAGTIAFCIFFSRTAGEKSYLRVADKVPIQTYLKREKIWAVVSVLISITVVCIATWYNLAINFAVV